MQQIGDCSHGMAVTQPGSLANIADVLDEKRCSWAIRCDMPNARGKQPGQAAGAMTGRRVIGGDAHMSVGRYMVDHFSSKVASWRTQTNPSRSPVFRAELAKAWSQMALVEDRPHFVEPRNGYSCAIEY